MKKILIVICLAVSGLSYAEPGEFDKFFDDLIREQEREVRELREMRQDFLLREKSEKNTVREEVRKIQSVLSRDFKRIREWIAGRPVTEIEPKVELKENKTSYDVRAELPGLKEENVKVSLEGNDLIIAATKEEKIETVKGEKTISEFEYGEFKREIHFDEKVDPKSLKIEFARGLVNVHVNKMKI